MSHTATTPGTERPVGRRCASAGSRRRRGCDWGRTLGRRLAPSQARPRRNSSCARRRNHSCTATTPPP